MKIKIAETDYDKEDCETLRNHIILLRDAALDSGHMEWTVTLSHAIAFMRVAIDNMWKE